MQRCTPEAASCNCSGRQNRVWFASRQIVGSPICRLTYNKNGELEVLSAAINNAVNQLHNDYHQMCYGMQFLPNWVAVVQSHCQFWLH